MPFLVISLAAIVAVVAINFDGGRLQSERRRIQIVSDAAALAAGADLYANWWTNHGLDLSGTAQAAAVNSAAANGIAASAVTVNIPPRSGTFAGHSGYVEVIIHTQVMETFGQAITNGPMPVTARSVARGQPMDIGLVLLQPSGAQTFRNNATSFALINSSLHVNSTDPAAYTQGSFGVMTANRFDVTGGISNTPGALLVGSVHTGVSPMPDPLQSFPVPSTAGVTVQSATPLTVNSILPVTLQPGIYQGGIHITGVSSVTLQSGVYIMQGGGFVIDGTSTVNGTGVMIYNTTSPANPTGPISITSQGKVTLSAAGSGVYQGITFFQDRNLTNPVSMTGVGLAVITGVVYAASAPVTLNGQATVGADVLGGAYVTQSLSVSGSGAINIDLKLNPPRVPDVRVVE
jgi:Putative Flp pilus-assembly TadE/G-like